MSQVTEPAGLLLPAQLQSPIRPPPLLHKIYQRPALQWTPRADVKARSLRPALTVQRDWTGQEPLPSSATRCGGRGAGSEPEPEPRGNRRLSRAQDFHPLSSLLRPRRRRGCWMLAGGWRARTRRQSRRVCVMVNDKASPSLGAGLTPSALSRFRLPRLLFSLLNLV